MITNDVAIQQIEMPDEIMDDQEIKEQEKENRNQTANNTNLPLSFKDAVARSTQWFDEAKRLQISSLE